MLSSALNSFDQIEEPPREFKVLIANDEQFILLMIQHVFQQSSIPCSTETVINGLQAFKKVKEAAEADPPVFYDLIVLDLSMPIIDGFETCSKITEFFCHDRLFLF